MAKRQRPKPIRSKGKSARRSEPAARKRPASSTPRQTPPLPPVARPSDQALTALQGAMAAMQRHDYGQAAARFREILQSYPSERGLLDRARVYLELCERELKRRPVEPHTVEERLTFATAALNDGDDDRAESLARSVLAEQPRHDLALYLLASVEARRGATEQALSYLGQAIAISPEARAQARHDPDFESLRHLDAFQELTELPPVTPGGVRRPRRTLPDR
jgi:Tfp pilus assembly protein PilF